jgi:hypothetical protein
LIVDAQLYCPVVITTGTVTVAQYATTVITNAAATAALNAAGTVPPIAGAVGIGRQIRMGIGSNIIPSNTGIYNITDWDGVGLLTIDKPFGEGSLIGSPFQIYKAYYAPPNFPFATAGSDSNSIRPISLTNRKSGYSVAGRRLHYTQQKLNLIDPVRAATSGDARVIAPYQSNSLGQPVWELYPPPTNPTVYAVTYYTRWPDLSPTVDLPQVPYNLMGAVLDLARSFAVQWAMANAATYPELQQTNWVAAMQAYKQEFKEEIALCLKQDDEIMPDIPFFQGRRRSDFPWGGQYLQQSDITGILLN